MLQPKQISKVLSQGLTPTPSISKSTRINSPLSLSLLSHSGLPLTTVTSSNLEQNGTLSVDNLRIYSLLATNHFKQNMSDEANESSGQEVAAWSGMEIDKGLHLIIQKLEYKDSEGQEDAEQKNGSDGGAGHSEDDLYVVIFYESGYPHEIAKLKINNVCGALAEGLKGYNREV